MTRPQSFSLIWMHLHCMWPSVRAPSFCSWLLMFGVSLNQITMVSDGMLLSTAVASIMACSLQHLLTLLLLSLDTLLRHFVSLSLRTIAILFQLCFIMKILSLNLYSCLYLFLFCPCFSDRSRLQAGPRVSVCNLVVMTAAIPSLFLLSIVFWQLLCQP